MSEVMILVEEMLNNGIEPATVAEVIGIPLEWVLAVDAEIASGNGTCEF